MTISESDFRHAMRHVFQAVGCEDSQARLTKRQCFLFVKMIAMPQLQQAEPEVESPKKQVVNMAKAKAEKKRKEEELEQEIAKGFDEHFAQLLEYGWDQDGNRIGFVDRAHLEELVMKRAEEKGIHIIR